MSTNGPDAREYIYKAWAPSEAVWSPWVKPVLFSVMGKFPPPPLLPAETFDLSWVPPQSRGAAIILDLPGEEGVLLGLELAKHGFRPVPLYNAVPGPTIQLIAGEVFAMPESVVDVKPILYALWRGAEELMKLTTPANAPPVFLLDANRRVGWRPMTGECFDNRSVCFVTDFPSTAFLKEHGICRVILTQRHQDQPQADLAHTLRRWRDEGMEIELKRLDAASPGRSLVLKPYSKFGEFWYRLCAKLSLVPNQLGGYGGIVGNSSGG